METLILLIPLAVLVLWVAAIVALSCLPKIHSKSRCAACGYSRDGLSGQPNCPECGHAHGMEIDPAYRAVVAKPRDLLGLILGPIAVGLVGSIVGFALTVGLLGMWSAPLSLIAGLAPVLPVLFVGLLASGRISRRVVWTLAIITPLPGVALAVAALVSMAPDLAFDALAGIGFIFIAIGGGVVSAFIAGLFGCIVAAVQRRHNATLRRNMALRPQP